MLADKTAVEPAGNRAPVPVRGTQSMVGVMAFVWKHPSLTGLELAWRWMAAAPLLWLAWHRLSPALRSIPIDYDRLENLTFFEPVRSVGILAGQLRPFEPALKGVAVWFVPLALILWTALATLGRTAVLRRASRSWRSPRTEGRAGVTAEGDRPRIHLRPARFAALAFLRALSFVALLGVWWLGILGAVRVTIVTPGRMGAEPNLVLFTAELVGLTLAAFLLWATTVWWIDLSALEASIAPGPGKTQGAHLRSKLIETNLVMGIVRVALFVLAMTFSASPLPFQSQETQAYINVWWVGVAIFYIVVSDLFHVVRRVTYLRLLQTIAVETNVTARSAS